MTVVKSYYLTGASYRSGDSLFHERAVCEAQQLGHSQEEGTDPNLAN